MKRKYYKDQIIETTSILDCAQEELMEMLFTVAFDGEIKNIDEILKHGTLNYRPEEFYQFDDPVLTRLAELVEHIQKIQSFLEETYPIGGDFLEDPYEA